VTQVGHIRGTKRALGLLEEEVMRPESAEDQPNVLKVLRPRGAVDEDIIEENQCGAPKGGHLCNSIGYCVILGFST